MTITPRMDLFLEKTPKMAEFMVIDGVSFFGYSEQKSSSLRAGRNGKMRCAFGFKSLYEKLISLVSIGYVPTYEKRVAGDVLQPAEYLDSVDGKIEQLLSSYLSYRGNFYLEENSPVEKDIELIREQVKLLDRKSALISRHVKRLRVFEGIIMEQLLQDMTQAELVNKGETASLFVKKYLWLKTLITGYKNLLISDMEFNSKVLQAEFLKGFGFRLRQARKLLGLKQNELGMMVGLSERVISSYETGSREPSLSTLIALSKKLSRPVTYFLGI